MSDGIYAAMSGAVARSTALDVIGNNVANSPTAGFRIDRVAFREAPAAPPDGTARQDGDLRMATVDAVVPSWRPGPIRSTGGTLDVAVEGEGLIAVQSEDGVRFVRGGSLQTDTEGRLMTTGGHQLIDPDGVPITVPLDGGEPVISEDGTIMVDEEEVGRMTFVWFESPAVLSREGDNLWSAAAGARAVPAEGSLRQGFLEQANRGSVRGMVDMITVTRSYEATIRAMETFRSIDQRTARDIAGG